jgi:hypothetical protein
MISKFDLQDSTRASSLKWKLTAGGLALAGVAMICASVALVKETPSLAKSELSVVAEGTVSPQRRERPEAPSNAGSVMQDVRQTEQLQVGNLETPPEFNRLPPNNSPLPAEGKASVDASHPAAPVSGGESAPVFTPASPNPAAALAAPATVKPDETPIATPSADSTDSAPPAEASKPAETPKLQANATQTTHLPTESTRPSIAKTDSTTRRPSGKTAPQKSAKSAKASAKQAAPAERQLPQPPQPKEEESSPQTAQDASNPTAIAPTPAPSIQQRVSDGITHAFGYVMHLPGALIPHSADPSAAAN